MYQKYNRKTSIPVESTSIGTAPAGEEEAGHNDEQIRHDVTGLDLTNIIDGDDEEAIPMRNRGSDTYRNIENPSSVHRNIRGNISRQEEAFCCKCCNGKVFLLVGTILLIVFIVGLSLVHSDIFCQERNKNELVTNNEFKESIWCKVEKAYATAIIIATGVISFMSMWCCYKMCT